jgi:type IV pilus assembly protein PilC
MSADSPFPLSREESRLLAEQLAVLAKAGLPLASGLRAAAEEMPSPRLAAAMAGVAERLEAGRSLDDVLRGSPRLMPEHMLRLIETGIRSGNLADVLSHLVEIDRATFDVRRSIRMAIAYPLLLMLLCMMLLSFVAMFVVPDLRQVMSDFGTDLPWITTTLFWFSGEKVVLILGTAFTAATMVFVLMRVSMAPQQWRWWTTKIPLFGPMFLWRGLANWARLAALLLKQGIPAPEAMRLAATGVSDALMAVEGLRLSRTVAGGRSVADSLEIIGSLPESIVPLVRWGAQHNSLAEAFDTVAGMFENRLRLRASLLNAVLPPIAFICVAFFGLWLMTATFLPLVNLISALSSWRRGGTTSDPGPFSDIRVQAFLVCVVGAIGCWVWIAALRKIMADPKGVRSENGDRAVLVFKIIGWVLFFFALAALMCTFANLVLGAILWIFTLIVALSVKIRHNDAERRTLMWLLGTAVDKGVPLATAARSFGEERHDRLGRQTRKMAFQLDRGIPLSQAIDNAGPNLPTDALVAVYAGKTTNSYAPLVNATTRRAPGIDDALHSISAKLMYVMAFLFFASISITFILIKIVPAYVKIFKDFNTKLPDSTLLFINAAYLAEGWIFLVVPLLLALLAAMIFALLRYTGLVRWDPPLVRSVASLLDRANILRNLSEAVVQKVPLQAMFDSLGQTYPKGYIRMKLYEAGHRIASGAHWCDSMKSVGLLSSPDAGVLKSAERVGNLSWAMNEVAARLSGRFVARVNSILAVLFPLVLFTFAAIVFLVACGMIEPIADLVMSLSGGSRRK